MSNSRLRRRRQIEQQNLCAVCEQPFVMVRRAVHDRAYRKAVGATLDHILPVSRGGTDDPKNLRTAHAICNEYRASEENAESLSLIEQGKKTADCVLYLLKDRWHRQTARHGVFGAESHAMLPAVDCGSARVTLGVDSRLTAAICRAGAP